MKTLTILAVIVELFTAKGVKTDPKRIPPPKVNFSQSPYL